MSSLARQIEEYIKALLEQESAGVVELQRNMLSEYFHCVPSQINYVLATRFTPDHGYVIESRRGGGGYIRIVRVMEQPGQTLLYTVTERIGDAVTEVQAARLIEQLVERKALTASEGAVMRAALSAQALAVPIPENIKNAQRARMLKCMLTAVARQDRPALG